MVCEKVVSAKKKIKNLNRRSKIRNREGEGRFLALNGVVWGGLFSTPRRSHICTLTTQQ